MTPSSVGSTTSSSGTSRTRRPPSMCFRSWPTHRSGPCSLRRCAAHDGNSGLVLARHKGHPAHVAQIRSQVIEYGAITELLLREVVRQERPRGLPATFKALIERAESTGLLDERGVAAANRLRDGRNRVHHDADARPFKISDASAALRDVVQVVNQCRTGAGLGPWVPTKPAPQ